jgi:hypothetical protein
VTLLSKRQCPTVIGSGSAHPSVGGHGNPKIHLAVNLVHLLATAGAVIETARELCEWLHVF